MSSLRINLSNLLNQSLDRKDSLFRIEPLEHVLHRADFDLVSLVVQLLKSFLAVFVAVESHLKHLLRSIELEMSCVCVVPLVLIHYVNYAFQEPERARLIPEPLVKQKRLLGKLLELLVDSPCLLIAIAPSPRVGLGLVGLAYLEVALTVDRQVEHDL